MKIIVQLIGATIGALLGALIIQVLTKWIARFKPAYKTAYLASFLGYIFPILIAFLMGFFIGLFGGKVTGSAVILITVIGFFVQSAVYMIFLKHPETGSIGYGRACLISAIQLSIGVILLIIIAVVGMLLKTTVPA
jgi:hypothetical protein